MSHTFKVNDTTISKRDLDYLPEAFQFSERRDIKRKLDGGTVYATPVKTIGGLAPFFNAFSYSFNQHFPLNITPDGVWLTILNGLGHHIDSDPEGLRHHFVQHKDKKEIEIKLASPSGLDKGLIPPYVWEAGINLFSEKIKNYIDKKHDLIVCNFSTTSKTDKLASMVSLMGAMKHYFKYKAILCCGLSTVTVAGTSEDWSNIYDRVSALSELGLEWWTDHLLPVIDQLRLSCEGSPNIDFWKAGYLAHRYGSGGQFDVSGWINVFYPYISQNKSSNLIKNKFVNWQANNDKDGVNPDDFQFGMSYAPVTVIDHGVKYDCKFYGGLVGVSLADDFTVKAESGIAIQNLNAESEPELPHIIDPIKVIIV